MRYLFTLLLFSLSIAAFAQEQPKSAEVKKDSVATPVIVNDTIFVDLREFDAYSRIIEIEMEGLSVQYRAEALKDRAKAVDEKRNLVIDGEVRHDQRFKNREITGQPVIIGDRLMVLVKKLPAQKPKPKK